MTRTCAMSQLGFSEAEYAGKKELTRREVVLAALARWCPVDNAAERDQTATFEG